LQEKARETLAKRERGLDAASPLDKDYRQKEVRVTVL
jgi:hypothetical protein